MVLFCSREDIGQGVSCPKKMRSGRLRERKWGRERGRGEKKNEQEDSRHVRCASVAVGEGKGRLIVFRSLNFRVLHTELTRTVEL